MSAPTVVGVDLSLTGTGLATPDGPSTVRIVNLEGPERLDRLRTVVTATARGADLVVLEGYSFGSKGSAMTGLAEAHGVVRLALWDLQRAGELGDWATVAPGTLKIYATGSGRAEKTAMVVTARERLGYGGLSHDEADALWLRALGLEHLGAPLVKVPILHRRAVKGVNVAPRPEAVAR